VSGTLAAPWVPEKGPSVDLAVIGVVLGVIGILATVCTAIWQVRSDRARKRRRTAKRWKAEFKAAKKRIGELEAAGQVKDG
jgi:hypothetical protein